MCFSWILWLFIAQYTCYETIRDDDRRKSASAGYRRVIQYILNKLLDSPPVVISSIASFLMKSLAYVFYNSLIKT